MKSTSSVKSITRKTATILLSLVFTLAFALPPASAVQAQGESGPGIEAFAWFDRYTLFNWPAGIPVEVTIAGPDYTAEAFTPEASDGWYEFFPGVDLKPGTTITASNGEGEGRTTKVLVISPLSGRVLDAATGKVKGEATPGRTFHMKTMGDNFPASIEQDIQTDRKGKWSVTIASFLPWAWFTRGEMWEADEDGDVTYAIWHVNQPVIEVWLPENEIRAFDWPLNTELTFRANGKVIGTATTQPVGWYDGTWAVLNAGELALKPGDIVMVSDEDVTKRTTVQDIKITYVNIDDNTVSGTGPVNAALELTSSAEAYVHFFNTGNSQEWTVSFTELNNGDYLRLFSRDRDKDSTVWDVKARNPVITVFPNGGEEVFANNWVAGKTLTLTVQDQETVVYSDTATVPPGDPPQDGWTEVRFGLQGAHDLKPGDLVTLTDGIITRTHTVRDMGINSVKIYDNTVGGWAESGAILQVWAHGYDQSTRWITAGEDGQWSVDFDPFKIDFGMCGRAQIFDGQGNGTAHDWCLPIPRIVAYPDRDEQVSADNWPEGSSLHMTIHDPMAPETPDFEMDAIVPPTDIPQEPWTTTWFNFKGLYDLKPGDVVTIADSTTDRTHTVRNLGISSASLYDNRVSGWADPGADLQVWAYEYNESNRWITADENGQWTVNFDPFILEFGMCGGAQIGDGDGNITLKNWCIQNPKLTAFPNDGEQISVENFPPGMHIFINIDDPATPEPLDAQQEADIPPVDKYWWTSVVVSFHGQYDLKVGDVITVTDGITTRTHTVRNLGITSVDMDTNSVSGWADAGTDLQVWAHGYDASSNWVTAGENGQWTANFGSFTLNLEMCGAAQVFDELGNGTVANWCTPQRPFLRAFPDSDQVDGWNWPVGESVNLTINGEPFGSAVPDETGIVVFPSLNGYDLKRGDTLRMWSGDLSVEYTSRQLFVNSIDLEAQIIFGTVDGQQQVHVFGGEIDEYLDSDETGHWTLYLSEHGTPMQPGLCVTAEAWGDPASASSTMVDWCVPGNYWREDFTGPELNPEWYWPNGDPGGWSLTDYGFLWLPLSHGGTSGGNLLLKGIQNGDFSVKTHIINFQPTANYQFAGLVIYQDGGNFLQLGRAYCEPSATCVGNGIYFDYVEGDVIGGHPNFATSIDSPDEVYLLLERQGSMVRGSYSYDGESWTEIGTHEVPADFQPGQIGIVGSQDFDELDADISAEFDFVELTEEGGFLP